LLTRGLNVIANARLRIVGSYWSLQQNARLIDAVNGTMWVSFCGLLVYTESKRRRICPRIYTYH
jgi:hypothetical protein